MHRMHVYTHAVHGSTEGEAQANTIVYFFFGDACCASFETYTIRPHYILDWQGQNDTLRQLDSRGCPPSLTLQKVLSDAEHRKTSPAETDFVPSKLPGMEATENANMRSIRHCEADRRRK